MSNEPLRRAIVNQGGFFSPYYLFDLLGRQHAGELDQLGREANRRLLRQTFRKATARFGESGSKPGEAWQAWYEELFTALGFGAESLRRLEAPVDAGRFGLTPISHAAWAPGAGAGEPPLVFVDLHGFGLDLDRARYPQAGKAAARGSFSLEPIARAIEFALDQSETRWALVAAGERLRLYRKGSSVARQYLEVNFTPLFDADRDDEWTAFWGLLRYEAFVPDRTGGKCLLDRVLEESQRHAARIADDLRENVVLAVEALIQGVLDDPANRGLVDRSDPQVVQRLFEEALYVLYRLLFVLYAESRDLLPLGESPIYRDAYSLEHLRELAEHELHPEGYAKTYYRDSLQTLFAMLRSGFPSVERPVPGAPFRIPAFNGQLFDPARTALLDRCRIGDRAMRLVIRELSLSRPRRRNDRRERYSYADLGVDQLGSIYEGLLVYEPMIAQEELVVAKVKGEERLLSRAQAEEHELPIVEGSERRPGSFVLRIWGGRRKGSGSYYTPQEITAFLVKEALEPLVAPILAGCAERDGRGRPSRSPEDILELKVCDPAMGSAAFLVQACRYLADAYGQARIAAGLDEDGRISPQELAHLRRRVAERCLYGVDLNPMAVELAKVSLWLETLAGDRPLTFLDAHLRCGNGLVGAPLRDSQGALSIDALLTIPEEALREHGKEVSRESKALASDRRRRNRDQIKRIQKLRKGQTSLPGTGQLSLAEFEAALADTLKRRQELEISDEGKSAADAVMLVHAKQHLLDRLQHDDASHYRRAKLICDLWCAVWFWPEPGTLLVIDGAEEEVPEPPTTASYLDLAASLLGAAPEELEAIAEQPVLRAAASIADQRRFFHWELEFPELWRDPTGRPKANGGLDAIVGNPPWDTVSSKVKEFFSNYDPLFRTLQGKKSRVRIVELRKDPQTDELWRRYDRGFLQLAAFFKKSGIYTWYAPGNLGKGDFNVYRTFVERNFYLLRRDGALALVLPDAFYLAANASMVRKKLITEGRFDYLYVIENRLGVFPIHRSIRIVLMNARRGGTTSKIEAAFLTGKDAEGNLLAPGLNNLKERLAEIRGEALAIPVPLISRLAPDTWSPPELHRQRDADLLAYFADHFPALANKASSWKAQLNRELDASGDSDIFFEADYLHEHGAIRQPPEHWLVGDEEYWPLYDGKMLYHFDVHYYPADKWVPAFRGLARMRQTDGREANMFYRLGWRDISATTNERTVITAIIPPRTFAKHKAPTLQGGFLTNDEAIALSCVMNSFVFDYQCRVRGKTMSFANLSEINVPTRDDAMELVRAGLQAICTYPEFAPLWEELALQVELPLGWSPDVVPQGRARAALRARIDAQVADLYGLSKANFAYILSTFPLLDRDQPPLPGEKKSTITRDLALLALYDLRQKEPPTDIVALFAEGGVDISRITGPVRDLNERVRAAWAQGAAAYVPSGHDEEEEIEEEEEESEEALDEE